MPKTAEEILESNDVDFDPESRWLFDGSVDDVIRAMQEHAIEFAQWIAEEGYEMLIGCYAWEKGHENPLPMTGVLPKKQFTTIQLYDLFIQSTQQ